MTEPGEPGELGRPVIRPLGDAAVLVEIGGAVGLETSRRVRELAAAVTAATSGEAGWGAPIPGACSLLVPVDPLSPGTVAAVARLQAIAAAGAARASVAPAGRTPAGPGSREPHDLDDVLEIPTTYDGPDLDAVAEMTGLSTAEVVARHAGPEYTTLFLGFAPGFGYLGPLAPELALPRRPLPRTHVPAGSVAIAGPQTAVYPIESPGGWWLIGRTDVLLWDPRRDPPAILRPGRRVRFVPA